MLFKTVVIVLACLAISEAQNEAKVVTISQGPVRGYKAAGSEVFQFFGIPYATVPTGSDRFKAPLPPPTWTDTLDAVEKNIACPQNYISTTYLHVQENCLVTNVFVPSTPKTNLPVVVYIHGGTYFGGDANSLSPKPLVESQKLVAVTLNYRLGAHGFLCLGTEDIPGNAGLRDMVAALRWVKKNIAYFGGNPDDVTLAGFSAGAAAVDLLSLSDATEGLFNKLILDSGVHVASWSVQMDPILSAQVHAQKLGFNDIENLEALEEFYKTVPYDLLTSDTIVKQNASIPFAPCIEKNLGQEMILDDSPLNIVRSSRHRNLPSLYGFGNMEGIFRMMEVFDEWAPRMNDNFSDFLVLDLEFENVDDKKELAQAVKEFYFGNKPVGVKTLFEFINYFTDVMFAYPVLRSVQLQNEGGNDKIFLYQYSFYNIYKQVPGVPDVVTNFPGANHCAQTRAILENIWTPNDDLHTEEYKQLRIKLRELWVNFITMGAPVPEGSSFPTWPPANASRSPYMILGDTIELGDIIDEERIQFWDSVYDKYIYHHPIPPRFEGVESKSNAAYTVSGSSLRNFLFIGVMFLCFL